MAAVRGVAGTLAVDVTPVRGVAGTLAVDVSAPGDCKMKPNNECFDVQQTCALQHVHIVGMFGDASC